MLIMWQRHERDDRLVWCNYCLQTIMNKTPQCICLELERERPLLRCSHNPPTHFIYHTPPTVRHPHKPPSHPDPPTLQKLHQAPRRPLQNKQAARFLRSPSKLSQALHSLAGLSPAVDIVPSTPGPSTCHIVSVGPVVTTGRPTPSLATAKQGWERTDTVERTVGAKRTPLRHWGCRGWGGDPLL